MIPIQLLKFFSDSPYAVKKYPMEGITLERIENLENLYNNGNPFPKVIREFLFLAGAQCGLLGVGSSIEWLQADVRQSLARNGDVINRPFFAFDYIDRGSFMMVYLDEGVDDPKVYNVETPPDEDYGFIYEQPGGNTFSELIAWRLDMVRQGFNPF